MFGFYEICKMRALMAIEAENRPALTVVVGRTVGAITDKAVDVCVSAATVVADLTERATIDHDLKIP